MIRKLLLRYPQAARRDLSGRRYVVTGCAEGSIGYATAQNLLQQGASVTISRRSGTGASVQNLAEYGTVDGHNLDLTNSASVAAFAEYVTNAHKRLDGLVNNAGVHFDLLSQWKEPKLIDGEEIHWRTNFLGTVELTKALLPRLEATAKDHSEARVINVVSMLHDKASNADLFGPLETYNSWRAYGKSKLGLMHYTRELDRRFSGQGVHAYCLHPGAVYTNIASKGLAGNKAVLKIRDIFSFSEKFFLMTPDEGAQTTLHCLVTDTSDLIGGSYYRSCKLAKTSDDAMDAEVSKRVWEQIEVIKTKRA